MHRHRILPKKDILCMKNNKQKKEKREMTAEERETSLNDMIRLALDTVWEFAE